MSAMPVMEGKAVLFQQFAGIDAHPLCIDASSVDEIVAVGKAMADMTVVVVGAGAAGLAIGKLLHLVGVGDLIGVDREGISTRRCWRATARAQSGGSRRTATAMPPPVVSPTR